MRLLVTLFLSMSLIHCFSQSLVTNFSVPSNVCREQNINLVNTSIGALNFEWDFCPRDSRNLIASSVLSSISGMAGGYAYKIVEDDSNWFGVAISQSNHSLFVLDFGSSPTNVPVVINLGNPQNQLLFPTGLELVKSGANWYAFVTSYNNDYGVVKLEFGTSLRNVPTASNIGMFGVSGRFWDVKVINASSNLIMLLPNRNGNSLVRVNFRDSFSNSVMGFVTEDVIAGADFPSAFDVVNTPMGWIGLLASYNSNAVQKLSFGNDLLMGINIENTYNFSGVINPFRIKIVPEGAEFTVAISSELAPLKLIDFFDFSASSSPEIISISSLPSLIGLAALRIHGQTYLQGIGYSSTSITQLVFQTTCNASLDFSTNFAPQGFTYNAPGYNSIELKAFDGSGNNSVKSLPLVVSGTIAPDISLSSQNVCANNDINFTSQNTSGGITDYNWDFGDAGSAMIANPTHQYTDAGDYDVSLQVTASNGCNNLAWETITIYSEPTANFNLPAATPICTNQDYLLTNTSTFDSGSNPSWQWEVNGSPVSSDQDLTYSIPSASQQDIKLIASIPGCSTEITKSILTVKDGPLADFTYANGCEDSAIAFTNTTSGTVTSYTWNFGDGNSSGQTNGSNTYVDFGNYDVTLSATNAAGCNNSVVKPIQIYSKPQPNFSLDLPPFSCNGSPSQFNDLTPNPTDSNLTGWVWSFGDGSGGTSISRNPQYTYALAGQYDVNLQATTNFGCTATTQKQITISQSPTTDFSFNAPCVNQATVFVDESGPSISSWQWKIGSSTYTQQNPTHVFGFPSIYNAMLTVTGTNGCIGIKSKSINVPAAPGLDFATENNCSGQNTLFTDASTLSADKPVSWQWQFGTLGSGTGAPTQFAFPSPGSYPAKLTVTNQSGCTYSFSKSITIAESPKANFIPTPQSGTPPLIVSFTNTSTNATSQSWFVNNSGSPASTVLSPTLTFDALGDYVVDLIAVNAAGCSDTFSQIISVVVPSLDVALTNLTLIPTTTGEVTVLISLLNNSNSSVKNPKVLLDITGETIISEILPITLLPGQSYSQALTTGVLATKAQLDYVCAQVVVDGDINSVNDKRCTNLESAAFIFDPYPNPASEQLTVEWVAADVNTATVAIFNSIGSAVFENEFAGQPAGLNRLTINLESLNPGAYFMRFTTGNTRKSFRLVIR